MGVILGTAALVIAKSGLGVDPAFWPMDIVAMLLGCLLGAFLPVFAKQAKKVGGNNETYITVSAWGMIAIVFAAIIFAGVPEDDYKNDWSFFVSFSLLGVATVVLIIGMILFAWLSEIGRWRSWHGHNLRAIKN